MQCPLETLVDIEPRLHRQNPNELHWKKLQDTDKERDHRSNDGGGGDDDVIVDDGDEEDSGGDEDTEGKGGDGDNSWRDATVGRLEKVICRSIFPVKTD